MKGKKIMLGVATLTLLVSASVVGGASQAVAGSGYTGGCSYTNDYGNAYNGSMNEAWGSLTDAGGCKFVQALITYQNSSGSISTGTGPQDTVTSKAWAGNTMWMTHLGYVWNTSGALFNTANW